MSDERMELSPEEATAAYMAGADGRWYIQGPSGDSGWWGDEPGFFIDLVVDLPEWNGQYHGNSRNAFIWIGRDHAQVLLMDGEYCAQHLRLDHTNMLAFLHDLPKPLEAYGAQDIPIEDLATEGER